MIEIDDRILYYLKMPDGLRLRKGNKVAKCCTNTAQIIVDYIVGRVGKIGGPYR